MTDEQIRCATAEKIMGWRTEPAETNGEPSCVAEQMAGVWVPWDPVAENDDADAVLDKIAEGPWDVDLNRNTGRWCCVIERGADDFVEACGEFSPTGRRRAICEAALRAVGAWEDGTE